MLLPFHNHLIETHKFDRELVPLADRHYSRTKIGAPQFGGNGESLVLRDSRGEVLFVWLRQRFRKDTQVGVLCSKFRNESPRLSSELILEAESLVMARWGAGRVFTYVDPTKITSRNPGYCFKKAGWRFVGISPKGLHILEKDLKNASPTLQ
jgi:hypothetical protein